MKMNDLNNTLKTQVIIVGAGPTGLSMAAQLLRYGIDFIIIEKNERTTPFSKALVVQARSLEIFDELGIAEKAIKEGQITTAMNVFYKGRRKAAVNINGLGEGLSPFPYALSLEQSKTEKLLVDHLASHQKLIQWGCEFSRYEQDDNGVTVFYTEGNNKEQRIRADYFVGCDGASSPVRHQAGLTFEGDTVPKLFYVADTILSSPVINRNELFMFMIRKGFVLFFPMEGEGHYRIVGILPEGNSIKDQFEFADIKDHITQNVSVPLGFKEVSWFSSYRVHTRKANSFESKRVYIAGDAAHIHTPAGGQGMNTGIQDAYNLAWKMAFTIRGQVGTEILSSYSTERIANAEHLLRTTDTLFDMMSGVNAFWNFIRLNFVTRIIGLLTKSAIVKKRTFPILSQIGITYAPNCLTVESTIGNVKAGVRMPYFILDDGTQIFDYINTPAFKILSFGSDENISTRLSEMKVPVVSHAFKEVPESLFGKSTNFYILLRPDNHISYIGYELNKCIAILSKISS